MLGPSPEQIQQLLNTPQSAELGPAARSGTRSADELDSELNSMFTVGGLSSSRQQLVRALILLWHDHLDASHSISQGIENADGSYVHAIMHRREPDYWNAKYWFRRVGKHPAYGELARRVSELLKHRGAGELTRKLLTRGEWDAFAFVDVCEQAQPGDELLREIQKIEFEVLLERFLAVDDSK